METPLENKKRKTGTENTSKKVIVLEDKIIKPPDSDQKNEVNECRGCIKLKQECT